MAKYLIEGKKWFDKVNGNTYHSVYITDVQTNKLIAKSEMEYGYGDQWKQTAYEELMKLGLATKEDRFNHELNRERFLFVDSDVTRKKDLFNESVPEKPEEVCKRCGSKELVFNQYVRGGTTTCQGCGSNDPIPRHYHKRTPRTQMLQGDTLKSNRGQGGYFRHPREHKRNAMRGARRRR